MTSLRRRAVGRNAEPTNTAAGAARAPPPSSCR